ncbi:MAG: hypothetical protein JWN84_1400 [Nocardioides sp.]|jgi:hypothetical protein|nr:hypothetical protein [Nocardioides sp.]
MTRAFEGDGRVVPGVSGNVGPMGVTLLTTEVVRRVAEPLGLRSESQVRGRRPDAAPGRGQREVYTHREVSPGPLVLLLRALGSAGAAP